MGYETGRPVLAGVPGGASQARFLHRLPNAGTRLRSDDAAAPALRPGRFHHLLRHPGDPASARPGGGDAQRTRPGLPGTAEGTARDVAPEPGRGRRPLDVRRRCHHDDATPPGRQSSTDWLHRRAVDPHGLHDRRRRQQDDVEVQGVARRPSGRVAGPPLAAHERHRRLPGDAGEGRRAAPAGVRIQRGASVEGAVRGHRHAVLEGDPREAAREAQQAGHRAGADDDFREGRDALAGGDGGPGL